MLGQPPVTTSSAQQKNKVSCACECVSVRRSVRVCCVCMIIISSLAPFECAELELAPFTIRDEM